jgi:hypothetical protein
VVVACLAVVQTHRDFHSLLSTRVLVSTTASKQRVHAWRPAGGVWAQVMQKGIQRVTRCKSSLAVDGAGIRITIPRNLSQVEADC